MDAIESVLPSVVWPENQNAGTIWGYQADVINGLLNHLQIRSDDANVTDLLKCLNMRFFVRVTERMILIRVGSTRSHYY